jgi:hypothetical protein
VNALLAPMYSFTSLIRSSRSLFNTTFPHPGISLIALEIQTTDRTSAKL